MDLGSVFSAVAGSLSGNSPDIQGYLAVKISSTAVVAATWKVVSGQVMVDQIGAHGIGGDSWDSLLQAADQAVSTALASETVTSVKTVFAVPYDWVESGKIVPAHLNDLRRLCKELDLSPQGFVVITEALENYYKEVEGAPLTAILIGVDKPNGFLTTYRAGRSLGTTRLKTNGDDIAPAVEAELKKVTQTEVLPSRIIIYDGKSDLDGIAQKLTAHPWTKQLPFLHFPKVEVAPAELVVKAVAVAGGVQLGGKFTLDRKNGETATSAVISREETVKPAHAPELGNEGLPETEPESPLELEEVSLEEAGFSAIETDQGTAAASTESSVKSFGQLTEMPISSLPSSPKKIALPRLINFAGVGAKSAALWGLISEKLRPLFSKATLWGGKGGSSKKTAITALAGVILVLTLVLSLVYFVPTTTAIIKVAPKPFEKEAEVIVVTDSTKTVSSSSATLVGSFIDVSEVGTKKGVASGKKLVGDKAKGSITIYSVSSGKNFAAGTSLASADGLKLTLDHDVAIASGDAITPATVITTVTATDIGDSYNFPAGTKFTVAGLPASQYLAKNEAALTGGNSHQANVVTKDDQDRLMATLSAELAERAKSDLQSKLSSGQNLLPNAITANISKKKFSKDVDAETDTVTLDLTTNYRGVVFSASDLVSIFVSKFAEDITSGFVLSENSVKINVKTAKNDKSGNSILLIHLSGNLLPAIDKSGLISRISGKSVSSATAIINNLPAVSAVHFDTKPRIFGSVTKVFLPIKRENIKVEIVSE